MRCRFCPRTADRRFHETWDVCQFCEAALNEGIEIGKTLGARKVLRKMRKEREK